ncbi:MAG: CocE/NonD family hydrolase [Rhizobiales bacterium]|nr:CocE/NonD family hydrolase [Hyphomicrobiales bacterium]
MNMITKFPREVREIENVFIPMSDGVKLAARIWLPADAEADPVPAILEYVPYRKSDGTIERDALTHPYFAGHGYAGVRVDIRGSGDSEGLLLGEYLKQEQDDALEIIAWLCAQPWCSGSVGMIGISWGGFNGLQVAARRPRALKAVISLCSTDDRYNDDIHFMGGCLLLDKFAWYSTMFSLNTAPPDPAHVGEKWRDMWMERLEKSGFWIEDWLRHQHRDDFYKHGSVCENWDAIECPVYAVGGWADGYSNAIFRLLSNLKGPKKGLIGPWAHKYPHFAKPGPQIGFLQECLRWWDQWLKGRETGIMDEPMLRVWMQDPARPAPFYETRDGRWVAENAWPSPRISATPYPLHDGRLGEAGTPAGQGTVSVSSPQTTGIAAGKWCPYGMFPDQPLDQRTEEGGQLIFDSAPLQEDVEILGAPIVELAVSVDKPNALLAVTLCEVFPDGAASRISYGLLNLTHRDSHETPAPVIPGELMPVRIRLNEAAHHFARGNRIRVAVSTAYWPIAWPSPATVTAKIDLRTSKLIMPERPSGADDGKLAEFLPAEHASPARQTYLREAVNGWTINFDAFTGETVVSRIGDEGVRRVEDLGLEVEIDRRHDYRIKADDPLSANAFFTWKRNYQRGSWRVWSETMLKVSCTARDFVLDATLDAYENGNRVTSRRWNMTIPRNLV